MRGQCFVRGTNSQLAPLSPTVVGKWITPLMHASDWLPTVAFLAGVSFPLKTGRPLDGYNQWPSIAHGAQSPRHSVVHNVPTARYGYQGAVRLGDMKLLFSGMQTVSSGVESSRYPPAGFIPAVADVFPQGVNITIANDETTTSLFKATPTAWLFNVSADPQEMTNLAADPAFAKELAAAIQFYQEYQKTAVDDLSHTHHGPDPAANPFLREDQAWGPYVDSKECTFG